jgi:thioredoxin reductase (NADPH)
MSLRREIASPVLFAFHEDQRALEAVRSQLVDRYAANYRVEALSDPEQALAGLAELARSGEEVALVLAGESVPAATGRELLERARQLHPHARRALVVPAGAWLDPPIAGAILDSMALGRIDYYVQRPADQPDEVFHQAISSFLLEWATERRLVPHTIHIVGEEWSGRAYELREVFQRCAVPHAFCLADSDEGRELLSQADAEVKLPLMILPDGRGLSDPSNAEIAEAAGAPLHFEDHAYDVVVVGAGPAGLSAAVYGASEGLRTIVVDEGGIGGQARSSSLIRNYLGFPSGVSGNRLAEQAYEQASVFGAGFVLMHRVTELRRSEGRFEISLADGRRINGAAVILATGAAYRRLGVPALEELNGAGVFYGGPASEAHAFIGKEVYVVGGGNSAGQAALHLARYARRVTVVVRSASLETGMASYLVREIAATPNVEVRPRTSVVGGGGDGYLQELVLRDDGAGADETVAADGLFVLIGARPHTDWLPGEIARDDGGFLLTGEDVPDAGHRALDGKPFALETSMPGVLAAGDVRHGSVKRVASAVGEGSIAVHLLHDLLARDRSGGPPADVATASASG